MNFLWSTLKVKDLEKSIDFYKDIIGLEVDRKIDADNNIKIAFLSDQRGTKLEFISDGSSNNIDIGDDISWGFEVASLDDTMSTLEEKNIDIISGPIQPNPNIRFIFIKDPDGLKVQLVEHIL